MNLISDFVNEGTIGLLNLGISKKAALSFLGEPTDWLGKSTVIGETHEFYYQSDLWIYYNGSVGVRFGQSGTANTIIIYPENAPKSPELFVRWPAMGNLKMSAWRRALQENQIAFREGDSDNYWIIAGQTCITCSFPFHAQGKVVDEYECTVLLLQKFSNVQTMHQECKYLNSTGE